MYVSMDDLHVSYEMRNKNLCMHAKQLLEKGNAKSF